MVRRTRLNVTLIRTLPLLLFLLSAHSFLSSPFFYQLVVLSLLLTNFDHTYMLVVTACMSTKITFMH